MNKVRFNYHCAIVMKLLGQFYEAIAPKVFKLLGIKNGVPIIFFWHMFKANLRYYGQVLGLIKKEDWESLNITFIISTGRTGTHFLHHFFNEVFENCHSEHEPDYSLNYLNTQYAAGRVSTKKAARLLLYYRKDIYNVIQKSAASNYIECNCYASLLSKPLIEAFGKVKFIYIHRDGRKVVRSYYSHPVKGKWSKTTYFYSEKSPRYRIKPKYFEDEEYKLRWKSFTRFEKIIWYWTKFNELILKDLEVIEDTMTVEFVHIFNEQRLQQVQAIAKFIGLKTHLTDEEIIKYLDENKSNQRKSHQLPSWDKWTDNQKQVFEEIAGNMMQKLGYRL